MTDYTVRINRVPDDIPRDVLIEHIAVAIQKIQKGRKALKKVGIQLIDESKPRKARKHPFDGPEVNDDLPVEPNFTWEGILTGGVTEPMFDNSYIIPKAQLESIGRDNLKRLQDLMRSEVIFSGKSEDQNYDTTLKGTISEVPEEVDVIEVELDMDQIVSEVYRAIGEDFPYLAELFQAKRDEHEVRRKAEFTEPPAEGDWELDSDDKVGDDID